MCVSSDVLRKRETGLAQENDGDPSHLVYVAGLGRRCSEGEGVPYTEGYLQLGAAPKEPLASAEAGVLRYLQMAAIFTRL